MLTKRRPVLGSLLAVVFYRFVKILEYETANPGQDFNEKEAEVFEFDEDNAATGADVARPVVGASVPKPIADDEVTSPGATSSSDQTVSRGASDADDNIKRSATTPGRLGSPEMKVEPLERRVLSDGAYRAGSDLEAGTHPAVNLSSSEF